MKSIRVEKFAGLVECATDTLAAWSHFFLLIMNFCRGGHMVSLAILDVGVGDWQARLPEW